MVTLSSIRQFADEVAHKSIKKTDVDKNAVVAIKAIKALFANAGHSPETNLRGKYKNHSGTLNGKKITYTYYDSQRGGARAPEARIGKLALSLKEGDEFIVVRHSTTVTFYVIRNGVQDRNAAVDLTEEMFLAGSDLKKLYAAASGAAASGKRVNGTAKVYRRNPLIQAFVKKAAGYKCQMPECSATLFKGVDGRNYVEVHHLQPLSEGGRDELENCTSLCPACHREVHAGKDKEALAEKLKQHMAGVHAAWGRKHTP